MSGGLDKPNDTASAGGNQADKLSPLERTICQVMYEWGDGWRFCDEQLVDYPHLVVSDDCSCQITVDMDSALFGCGCICHEKTRELAKLIARKLSKGTDLATTSPDTNTSTANPPKGAGRDIANE